MPSWTSNQQSAIDARDRMTVVSARAGSGKTAVLTQRAVDIICDGNNPVPADRLLIVTFSRASAREFKHRIERGINEKIKQEPKNIYLRTQRSALQKADICTIHSFCVKLCRENFRRLGLPYDFTICDDPGANQLHDASISAAMAYGYSDEDFTQLVSFYGKSSSDKDMRTFLRGMDTFYSALPHPKQAALKHMEEYCQDTRLRESPRARQLWDCIARLCRYLKRLSGRILCLLESRDFDEYNCGAAEIDRWTQQLNEFCTAKDSASLKILARDGVPPLGKVKKATELSENAKDIRAEIAKNADRISELASYLDRDKFSQDVDRTAKYVIALYRVFFKYQEILDRLKRERKSFEFSDFEHFALSLLQREDGTPTALSLELREKYLYIMEDEFQDTSFVQDAIFSMISQPGNRNLYVVGDVKQSIYSFRKASPEIFLEKREQGISGKDGQTIFLSHNFRSDRPVVDGVNFLFTRLMSPHVGGVSYGDTEKLVTLKQKENRAGVQIKIFDTRERRGVADIIDSMVKSGYRINDNGKERAVVPGDFCVLMRASTKFPAFRQEIEKLGYKTVVRDNEPLVNKPEVEQILNLLRVVSNPLQEVPLTASMFGDMFGFTLDEILSERLSKPGQNLYAALTSSKNPKACEMLKILGDIKYASGVYSADKLIDYVCERTGYYQKLAFSPRGREKRENIRLFIAMAKDWAASHDNDLAAFLRWTELYIRDRNSENPIKMSSDSVAIMTIHNSKGLEFPICIVRGLGTNFNKIDLYKRLMTDVKLGVGMYVNTSYGFNRSTLRIRAIKEKARRERASEEMRLLYVAFTRAKNLLVATRTGGNRNLEKSAKKISALFDGCPDPEYLVYAYSPINWVLSALPEKIPRDRGITLEFLTSPEEVRGVNVLSGNSPVSADRERISRNLSFVYPHKDRTLLPVKLSVSEIAKTKPLALAKPDFMGDVGKSGAKRGTEIHRFLRQADLAAAREDLERELESLSERNLVDPRLLNIKSLKRFLAGPVAAMILGSEHCYREQEFLFPCDGQVATGNPAFRGDKVLVQGVMDCIIENGDEITVIDYKTDSVPDIKTLRHRYASQLELYRQGAKRLFGKEDVRCLIYSFHLDEYMIF